MLTVYKFVGDWGLPDLSPFCIKLETYLRMAGLEYRTAVGDSRKAPKKKLPYIVDDAGRTLPDSDAIVRHLEATGGKPLDAWLDARQRALGEAFRALLEDAHYFVIMYVRWCTPEGRATYKPTLLRYLEALKVPRLLHPLAMAGGRRNLQSQAWLQGIARHTPEEIVEIGKRHWTAVADFLGDNPYLLGEQPSSYDAALYAFLVSTIDVPFETPVKAHALALPNLVAYRDRMRARYWAT